MSSPELDTDNIEEPAPIESIEDTEPVELEEGDESEVADPPEEWATDLTDADIDERFAGVDLTPDPEDGSE